MKLLRKFRKLTAILLLAAPMISRALHSNAGNLENCGIDRVTTLPGSREFASDFIEAIAGVPSGQSSAVWALTADMSSTVPYRKRALYLSKSLDGGKTWATVARIGPRYFDAKIGEGLRNGLAVAPGGNDFVVTTQEGAFQITAHSDRPAQIRRIAGPSVPMGRPRIAIAKHPGEPVRAGVVKMTADGKYMIVGYGYFDLDPQLFRYRRDRRGDWIEDGTLPHIPTDLDIFSMDFDRPNNPKPRSLYVGTGDQAYRLDLRTNRWTEIQGVGPDSAIHSMSTIGGPHFAACWGVYNPVDADTVARVTHASFLLHPGKDESGPNIRAYSVEVDPLRPNRQVVTAITGVYTSRDGGHTWKRINNLPETEFHTSHINPDGSVIVSGLAGTYVVDPFSNTCQPALRRRN